MPSCFVSKFQGSKYSYIRCKVKNQSKNINPHPCCLAPHFLFFIIMNLQRCEFVVSPSVSFSQTCPVAVASSLSRPTDSISCFQVIPLRWSNDPQWSPGGCASLRWDEEHHHPGRHALCAAHPDGGALLRSELRGGDERGGGSNAKPSSLGVSMYYRSCIETI